MFKKLRIKFIAITMVMVALVMAFAFTAACISEYQRSMAVVNTALSDAVDNAISIADRGKRKFDDGHVPPELRSMGSAGPSDGQSEDATGESADDGKAGASIASEPESVLASASGEPTMARDARLAVEDAIAQVLSPLRAYAVEGAGQDGASRSGGAAAPGRQDKQQDMQAQGQADDPGMPDEQGQAEQPRQTEQSVASQSGAQPSESEDAADAAQGDDQPQAREAAQDEGALAFDGASGVQGQQRPSGREESDGDDGLAEAREPDEGGVPSQEAQVESRTAASSQDADPEGRSDAASDGATTQSRQSEAVGVTSGSGSQVAAEGDDSGQDDSGQDDSITFDDDSAGATAPPTIGFRGGGQRAMSSIVPVAVYNVSASGTMRAVPEVTTASLSQDVLMEAAQLANAGEEGYSAYPDLSLYGLKKQEGDTTYIAFADASYTDGWKSLATVLAAAGAGTLVLFFVICLFYSNWALRPVREAWDSQRQFVADASHDLKTPLTVILANASILLKHPERTIASESQWIESTQKEAEDMQGLVNEMLELAQIEAGQKLEVAREPIDFSDLVDGETLMFDSVALERSCAFECALEGEISVSADEKQVRKLVSTLVENAFKYVDEGGTVAITLKREGRCAVLAIRNTGSVISEEDLPHIFDRFYRTDKARTSGAGGFGLGLAIAREIAVQHGGDITCASDEQQGTTFTVTLPAI